MGTYDGPEWIMRMLQGGQQQQMYTTTSASGDQRTLHQKIDHLAHLGGLGGLCGIGLADQYRDFNYGLSNAYRMPPQSPPEPRQPTRLDRFIVWYKRDFIENTAIAATLTYAAFKVLIG